MRIKVFFSESSSLPEIKKIVAVGEKQLHIKRVVNGVEAVADFNFANLADGKSFRQSKDNTVYTVEALTDSTTFIKVAAGVATGQSVPENIDTTQTTFPFYPYLADGETETTETPDATPSGLPTAETTDEKKTRIRSAAVSHARTCIDLMNAGWAINNAGGFDSDLARWKNTRLWILSALAAIDAILDSTDSAWTVDVAENALMAYQSLVPANRVDIETWYFAHNATIYSAYFGSAASVGAYFKWTKGAASPAFASDATSSTAWDGTGETLNVSFSAEATPEDFSS